jgi:hypothetical protein
MLAKSSKKNRGGQHEHFQDNRCAWDHDGGPHCRGPGSPGIRSTGWVRRVRASELAGGDDLPSRMPSSSIRRQLATLPCGRRRLATVQRSWLVTRAIEPASARSSSRLDPNSYPTRISSSSVSNKAPAVGGPGLHMPTHVRLLCDLGSRRCSNA